MGRARFTIAALLGIIALVGLGLAALRDPSRLWGSIVFSAALSLFTIAGGGVLYRRGRRRAFWVGFALGGWLYLALSLLPPLAPVTRPHLVTTALLVLLENGVLGLKPDPPPATAQPTSWDLWRGPEVHGGEFENVRGGHGAYFYSPRLNWVGHSLWSLLVAATGGIFFRFFYETRPKPDDGASD